MMSNPKEEMQCDHEIGGGWGCHISWNDHKNFEDSKLWNENTLFRVLGHLPNIPKVGESLLGDFTKSFVKFEFVSVDRCDNPRDMFFAKVKMVKQIAK